MPSTKEPKAQGIQDAPKEPKAPKSFIESCDGCGKMTNVEVVVENMMGMDIRFCPICKAESEAGMPK